MNNEMAKEAGADMAKADGQFVDYYRQDMKIGTRKCGSHVDAHQVAESFNQRVRG